MTARGLDLANLSELLGSVQSGDCTVEKGDIVSRDGSHFEIHGNQCVVHVTLKPTGQPISAVLGGLGLGAGRGIWGIPPVGTEVIILVPHGDAEGDHVCLGATRGIPSELEDYAIVVKGANILVYADEGDVTIQSAGTVTLGGEAALTAQDGVLTGKSIDPFTGSMHFALGNASGRVLAKK